MRDRSATYGRISCAPSEQLMPTINGSACSTEVQNASVVCPVSVRPERSTMVTLIQSGSSGAVSRAATIAAFALRGSKIVSISSRSTPPSTRPRICSAYAAFTWSKVCVRYPGSSTRGDNVRVMFSGPTEPATNRSPADSRAMRAPATFMS